MFKSLARMSTYAINTSMHKAQKRVAPRKFDEKAFRSLAAYLATVNRSKGDWQYTFVRRVFVDNSTQPVTFWVGSNHGASIVKLTPLD